jgi:hypothetical protein
MQYLIEKSLQNAMRVLMGDLKNKNMRACSSGAAWSYLGGGGYGNGKKKRPSKRWMPNDIWEKILF